MAFLFSESVLESKKLVSYLFFLAGIFGVMSLLVSFYLMKKEIVKPLNRLVKHIVKIREDGTYIHSDLEERQDEIGTMAKEFNCLLEKLHEKNAELTLMARIDSLTGLSNRMDLEARFEKERAFSCREEKELSILMLDIDYFKKYNDTYGHVMGDEVLIAVADAIQSFGLRPHDYIARYGGEEFIVLLPETFISGAVVVAKRIIKNVEKLGIEHESTPLEKKIISVSIGCVSTIARKEDTQEYLINMADEALYTAKERGRDGYYIYNKNNA